MRLQSNDAILGTFQYELITFTEGAVDDLEALSDRVLDGYAGITVHIIESIVFRGSGLAVLSCIEELSLGI